MSDRNAVKFSFYLNADVCDVIAQLAQSTGLESTAYIQRVLSRHAAQSGIMEEAARERIELYEKLIGEAEQRARQLDAAGKFDPHFVRTVFRELMSDSDYRADYERYVGGDAYESGLPGKSPLNMYLGWYIKNAIGAESVLDANRKPRRAQVRNEAIQSYTLLKKPETAATD